MGRIDLVQDSMQDTLNNIVSYSRDHQGIVLSATAVAILGSLLIVGSSGKDKRKPGTRELGGGSIEKANIKREYDDYSKAYGKEAGDGILDRTKTTELVNTFYNLVTDIYEWGWGQSFHFSPLLPGKTPAASEAAHEGRLAALLRLQPGMKCLDVGCGVGGPMRTIASTSGAEVTGITINDYQVQRATYHNEKVGRLHILITAYALAPSVLTILFDIVMLLQHGVASLCQAVEGNFLSMPFAEASFDGAYAIEATCHADKVSTYFSRLAAIKTTLFLWFQNPSSVCSCKMPMLKCTVCSNLDLILPAMSGSQPRSMTQKTEIMSASWMKSTMAMVCRYVILSCTRLTHTHSLRHTHAGC